MSEKIKTLVTLRAIYPKKIDQIFVFFADQEFFHLMAPLDIYDLKKNEI